MKNERKNFISLFMKGVFLCKRGREDIQTGIAFLATRTSEPTEEDWNKLCKLMSYLKCTTSEEAMRVEADDKARIYWWVDASFSVYRDMKSHTGAVMSLGKGVICSPSTKQKSNARSSTEAELIAMDDVISRISWTERFLHHQGFENVTTIIYRDNTSTISNGRESASKRTRHLDIK